MSETTGARRPPPRNVLLNPREQKAVAWLLSASDNGSIISGAELPNITTLAGIKKRLLRNPHDAK